MLLCVFIMCHGSDQRLQYQLLGWLRCNGAATWPSCDAGYAATNAAIADQKIVMGLDMGHVRDPQ